MSEKAQPSGVAQQIQEVPEIQGIHDVENQARRFREAYGRHRAAEGRGKTSEMLLLPFVEHGALAEQWRVRACTFKRFMRQVVAARAAEVAPRALRVADLGAGNGWLCYRLALRGHVDVALDVRTDDVDGLGAAAVYAQRLAQPITCVAASFNALPLASRSCDLAVFNASLHYALDLADALREAARIVIPGGRIVILDSPFYSREEEGDAMVSEKRKNAEARFGALAQDLTALPFIEFLTRARLDAASARIGVQWQRHRVRYPLWYEARPYIAWLRRRRAPSRFDLWEAVVP